MIPVNSLISEEEVISRIKVELRLTDTTEHDAHLEILLREGLGSLNCISQLEKKQCQLTADDNTMMLPKDLVRFIALRPKSWLPSTATSPVPSGLPTECGRFIYADNAFLNSCGCDSSRTVRFQYGFQINKGFIHFNSNMQIDQATIAYFGLWLDNGKPAIFERFERALTAYSCWKFIRTWLERYNQFQMMDYKNEWILQKDFLKGQDVQRDFDLNKLAVSEIMRALIVSPLVLAP